VIAVVLQVTLQNQIGRLKTYAPGGGGWQVAHIHRKEITPGGQYIQPSATRRTTGPRRHKAAMQGIQQALHLGRAASIQTRRHDLQQGLENPPHFQPLRGFGQLQSAGQCLFNQLPDIQFQTLAGIPGSAPQRITDRHQRRRLACCPGFGQRTVKRVKTQIEGLGQCP